MPRVVVSVKSCDGNNKLILALAFEIAIKLGRNAPPYENCCQPNGNQADEHEGESEFLSKLHCLKTTISKKAL
jgi:hypothetical protein